MPDLRLIVFITLTTIVLSATAYSVIFGTYLDTSNPRLSHLPHSLSRTHYYANKSNFLNVYFIKKAWGWTSAAFWFSWWTSPPTIRSKQRLWKWATETGIWLIFTTWFFGPALFERVILASGGECGLLLPSSEYITLPAEHCLTRSSISSTSHPYLFVTSSSVIPPVDWHGRPRLRSGHDVSGHVFLLTMSALFLADQVRSSLSVSRRSILHNIATLATAALILVWLFAAYTTSIYFHSPLEKISGYFLGVSGFAVLFLLR